MAHRPMAIYRAQGHADRLQPLTGGSDGVPARLAFALEQTRRLLLRPRRFAAGIEPGMGMGEGACRGEDRRDRGEEGIAWCRSGHPPHQAKPDRNSFRRLPVPGRNTDRGVDQLVRKDGRDLRRHRVGRGRQVQTDGDIEMAIAAAPVIPALADRHANAARGGRRPASHASQTAWQMDCQHIWKRFHTASA